MKTLKILPALLLAATVVLTGVQPLLAQSKPLDENQQAVVHFEVNVQKLLANKELLGEAGQQAANQEFQDDVFGGVKAADIKRFVGSVNLPEKMGAIMQMGPGQDVPFEFYVQVEFQDAQTCALVEKNLSEKGDTQTLEIGGKTYLQPPASEGLQNLVAHRLNETTFEMGTKTYVLNADRNVLTPTLKTTVAGIPDDAVKIALDMQSRAALVAELIGFAKENGPPQAAMFVDVLDNIKTLSISMDPVNENLLTLRAVGIDDTNAEEIQGLLDSLMGMGKMFGMGELGKLSQAVPEVAQPGKEIFNSMKASREGDVVQVVIPRPEGFDEAVSKLQAFGKAQADLMIGKNNMRQLGLGCLNYESAYEQFPFVLSDDDERSAELGWRTRILPFIEENRVYEEMDFKKGPGVEPNSQFSDKMPKIFGDDGSNSNVSWIKSDISGFGDITDGSSNTIMMLENPAGEPWMENNSLTIDQAVALVKALGDGEELNALFYDCSIRTFNNSIDEQTLRNLLDPQDGNVIELED